MKLDFRLSEDILEKSLKIESLKEIKYVFLHFIMKLIFVMNNRKKYIGKYRHIDENFL